MSKKTIQTQNKYIEKKGMIHSVLDEHLIFLVEAMAVNDKIYDDINELFDSKSRVFTEYAENSELYNHPLIISGSIEYEEQSRKILGILLHTRESGNKKQTDIIHETIYKGWPRASRNIVNHRNVNIEAYINSLKNDTKHNYTENAAELFIFYMICVNCKIPIINPKLVVGYFTSLSLRTYVYSNEMYFDNFNHKEEELQKKLIAFKDDLIKEYGILVSSDNQIRIRNKELQKYFKSMYRLAYSDKIELYCLFREIELDDKDINDILCSFSFEALDECNDESARQFVSAIMIKLLVKSIKRTKELYYKQIANPLPNRADAKSLDNLEKENQRLLSENRNKNQRIDELNDRLRMSKNETEKPLLDKIRELERQLAKQQDIIYQEKEKDKELAALREFFFSMENQNATTDTAQETQAVMDLKDTVAAIIGGNQKWVARMKELLPNWVFITSTGFDKRSLDNIQTVFFVPNSMSHSLYYKAVSIARNRNMDIGFIYSQNEQLALKDIAKALARAGY
ncbi:MAG: hypothetical protein FWG88_03135 [Oscillospiraceae bacterium]|nr:hypothetical protein [Oscillospiraceae bacterium]